MTLMWRVLMRFQGNELFRNGDSLSALGKYNMVKRHQPEPALPFPQVLIAALVDAETPDRL